MIRRILGLDISSSTIGFCLLLLDEKTGKIKLDTLNHYKPTKKGTVLERLQDTRDKIADIISHLRPTDVAIEDIITYMPHRSNANTIILLALFNRMIALLSMDYLGKSPIFYSVMDIRRGLQEGEKAPDKEEMPELIAKKLSIKFPWMLNKNGKKIDENMDRADGCAVALFHCYILSGLRPTPPPKNKKTKRKNKKK